MSSPAVALSYQKPYAIPESSMLYQKALCYYTRKSYAIPESTRKPYATPENTRKPYATPESPMTWLCWCRFMQLRFLWKRSQQHMS